MSHMEIAVMRMRYKGSYTVEAAWLMGLLLSLTCFAMLLGYKVYHNTIAYMAVPVEELEAAEEFRKGERLRKWTEDRKGRNEDGTTIQEKP